MSCAKARITPRMTPSTPPVSTMSVRRGQTRSFRRYCRINDGERVLLPRIGEHVGLGFVLYQAVHHTLNLDYVCLCNLVIQILDVPAGLVQRPGADQLISERNELVRPARRDVGSVHLIAIVVVPRSSSSTIERTSIAELVDREPKGRWLTCNGEELRHQIVSPHEFLDQATRPKDSLSFMTGPAFFQLMPAMLASPPNWFASEASAAHAFARWLQ